MAVREIVAVGHPVLRERAAEADPADPAVQSLIDDLIDTVRAANGAGLAAPQIGVPLRVAVVEVRPGNPRYPYKPVVPLTVLVNPSIEPLTDETVQTNEGCLSIGDLRGEVTRHVEIAVRYLDRAGRPCEEERRGVTAGTFQHEVDHLDGVLILDRVTDPRTFTTWGEFEGRHREAFVARMEALVARFGS